MKINRSSRTNGFGVLEHPAYPPNKDNPTARLVQESRARARAVAGESLTVEEQMFFDSHPTRVQSRRLGCVCWGAAAAWRYDTHNRQAYG